MLAASTEKIVGQRFCRRDRVQTRDTLVSISQILLASRAWRKSLKRLRLKQLVCTTKQVNVAPRLLFGWHVRHAHHLIDPVLIDARVPAIAGQQWHRHTRNPGQQDFVDRLFQNIQTSHSANRIDVSADQNLQDDRATFGNENFVAKVLRSLAEIGNITSTASFAREAKLVIVGGATFGMFQAMWQ